MNTVVKTATGSAQATCSQCHSTGLRNAHGATGGPLATTTKGVYVTCQECHAYTNVTALITDAHAQRRVLGVPHERRARRGARGPRDNAAGRHDHVREQHRLRNTGTGCHGTTYDLHEIHKNSALGCTLTGCHDAVNKSLTASTTTCGKATGCHPSTTYTPTAHNGATGDDATHHSATGNTSSSLGGYTQSTACTLCHSVTQLNTAHATTSLATDATCATGGSSGNGGCHNSTVITSAPRRRCTTAGRPRSATTATARRALRTTTTTLRPTRSRPPGARSPARATTSTSTRRRASTSGRCTTSERGLRRHRHRRPGLDAARVTRSTRR